MVDFFLLLMIPGAGDELQGIKRGVVELADALFVNKADGDNTRRAEASRIEYERALDYLLPATKGWRTRAYSGSALTGDGVDEMWGVIERFAEETRASGVFAQRRREQNLTWFRDLVTAQLMSRFYEHGEVGRVLPDIEKSVAEGKVPATQAVEYLMDLYRS